MEQPAVPEGEFHHFQLVDAEGKIPVSISVLVHYNHQQALAQAALQEPIEENDIIDFHYALKEFDGNYIKAFGK